MENDSYSGVVEALDGHIDSTFTNMSILVVSTHSELRVAQRYGRRFILKSLPQNYRGLPVYEAQLEKEFNISIMMNHPNVVQTIGFELVPGLGNTIVMEYVDGVTLHEWIENNPSQQERYDVLLQILDGVNYIHSHQVIHRDLKPRNILVTRNGQHVKVIDFGLSDTDSYAIFKQPAGTKRYISPEQRQSGAHVDLRSDIYSIGVIVSDLFPRGYSSIVKRCCEQDPMRRFSSVEQLRKALVRSQYCRWMSVPLFILLLGVVIGSVLFLREQPQLVDTKEDEVKAAGDSLPIHMEKEKEQPQLVDAREEEIKEAGNSLSSIHLEEEKAKNDFIPESKKTKNNQTKEQRDSAVMSGRVAQVKAEAEQKCREMKQAYDQALKCSEYSEHLTQKIANLSSCYVLDFYRRTICSNWSKAEYNAYFSVFVENNNYHQKMMEAAKQLPSYAQLYHKGEITALVYDSLDSVFEDIFKETSPWLVDSISYYNGQFYQWSVIHLQ